MTACCAAAAASFSRKGPRTECGHVLHPDGCAFDRREIFRISGHRIGGNDGAFSVDTVFADGKGRNGAHPITELNIINPRSYGIDDAGGFVSESLRKYRRFQILALPEHYFGTVEADRFHLQADLPFAGFGKRHIFQLEYVGGSCFMKKNYFWHGFSPTLLLSGNRYHLKT